MFTDEILTKIFSHPAIMTLDLNTQSAVVHAIESIMDEEEKQNADESVSDATVSNIPTGV